MEDPIDSGFRCDNLNLGEEIMKNHRSDCFCLHCVIGGLGDVKYIDLTCGECGKTDEASMFCDPTASEPHCKDCAEGFWEMMGDDPCGKDWG